MIASSPANCNSIELIGATARIASPTPPVGVTNARTVEFFADFMPLKFSTTQPNCALLGTYVGGYWFEYDAPTTNSTNVAPLRFGSVRNSVDKYSGDGEITLGKRTRVMGKDDGTNVYAWQDGQALGVATSQAAWSAAEVAYSLAIPSPIYFGYDSVSVLYTAMRIYEVWIKLNGVLVLHYRPTQDDMNGAATTLADLSGLANTGTPTGTLNTDYRWNGVWNKVGSLEGVEA